MSEKIKPPLITEIDNGKGVTSSMPKSEFVLPKKQTDKDNVKKNTRKKLNIQKCDVDLIGDAASSGNFGHKDCDGWVPLPA